MAFAEPVEIQEARDLSCRSAGPCIVDAFSLRDEEEDSNAGEATSTPLVKPLASSTESSDEEEEADGVQRPEQSGSGDVEDKWDKCRYKCRECGRVSHLSYVR